MRLFLALAIASVTLLTTSLSANALTFKSGESKSFGKDASELESKDRGKAGFSVPAKGLFLTKIIYPSNIFLK